MNLHNLSRHVRLIIRGEMLAVQAKLAFALRRTLFAGFALLFAGLGIGWRRNLQAHKRSMLVASIGMLDAAIALFPASWMARALKYKPGRILE